MGMRLPRIAIDHAGDHSTASARRADLLRPGELSLVLGYDRGGAGRKDTGVADRCVPLGGNRWMVGRRRGSVTIWRLVDAEAAARLGHPAWLWIKDWWFDPSLDESAEGPLPPRLPLRGAIRYAAAVSNPRSTVSALAAVVGALRTRTPVALVVSGSATAHPGNPARWFALSVLAMVPPDVRARLRIGVGEPDPDPSRFDFVTTTHDRTEGFRRVDAMAPSSDPDDLVAYFVRNRLLAGDPEAIEAAAEPEEAEAGSDPQLLGPEALWGAAIERRLRVAVPGLTRPTDEQLAKEPEAAVFAVLARVRAGAPLTPDVVEDLVRVTVRTGDLRPWASLADRPEDERASAVSALLDAGLGDPRPELVAVVAATRPRGADTGRWIAAVAGWLRAGLASERLAATAIDELAGDVDPGARLSLLVELASTLGAAGLGRAATEALVSPAAAATVRVALGNSRANGREAAKALVAAWVAIPATRRAHEHLPAFIELLRKAPDSGPAIEALLRRLGDGRRELAATLVSLPIREIQRYSAVLRIPPDDPAWVDAEATLGAGRTARQRLVAFSRLGPGLPALEIVARGLAPAAIAESVFPDGELAEVALALAQIPDRSALWPWLAISAAAPDRFPPEVFEPAVVGVTVELPETPALVDTAYAAGHRLGASSFWGVGELARLILLLLTAPDGGWASPFGVALAQSIVQGVALQPDAIPRLVDVTVSMSALGVNDPNLQVFLRWILPNAWLVGFPRLYLDEVRRVGLPPDVARLWERVVRE